jgi:hypothetical protein
MIVNTPTPAQLDDAAKTAFFAGWNELMHLIADFETYHNLEPKQAHEERQEYYEHCSADLEKVLVWASHANELALKAIICAESPYLLLLGTDTRFKATGADIDFTELRTIDAVDLPTTVNAVSPSSLSPQFISQYSQLRTARNKHTHQGTAGTAFAPEDLIDLMAFQYAELWPGGRFLADWMSYVSRTRFSYFHDGKWSTPHMEIAETFATFCGHLKDGQTKALLGVSKKTRRYVCHHCYYEGSLGRSGAHVSEFYTAYLKAKTSLYCMLCEETYEVDRENCSDVNCPGNVISGEGCHTCGR